MSERCGRRVSGPSRARINLYQRFSKPRATSATHRRASPDSGGHVKTPNALLTIFRPSSSLDSTRPPRLIPTRLFMTGAEVLDVGRDVIWLTLQLCAPCLIVGLVVGVAIGLFQALTQIQEQTLVYAPKIVAI